MKYCRKEDDVFYHTVMTNTKTQPSTKTEKSSKNNGLIYTLGPFGDPPGPFGKPPGPFGELLGPFANLVFLITL